MTEHELYNELVELSTDHNKAFSTKLIHTKASILGVTTPNMRAVGKKLLNEVDFVMNLPDNKYYEFDVLKGFVLVNSKISMEERIELFRLYLPTIDNWAVCDLTATKMKLKGNDKEVLWQYILELFENKACFCKRFALITCLSNLLDEHTLPIIFDFLRRTEYGEYYFDMAAAWFLSVTYIKFKNETVEFLTSKSNLNKFTHNKAIQKIIESYRVSPQDKEFAKSLKIE